jgi:hypothetical protein
MKRLNEYRNWMSYGVLGAVVLSCGAATAGGQSTDRESSLSLPKTWPAQPAMGNGFY